MLIINESVKNLIDLPRYKKKIIAIIIDLGLCILCTWLAFYLRLEEFIKINNITILAVVISITIAIPIFWLLGLYKAMFRFAGSSIIISIAVAIFSYGLLYFSVIGIYGIYGIPRSIGIIQPLLLFFGILSSRLIVKFFLVRATNPYKNYPNNKKIVLIYGAGSAGRQLLSNLENNTEMKVLGFLDDDKKLHNQLMMGQMVYSPLKIQQIIQSKNIDLVLLALPSISRTKRNQIINNLNNYPITVKTLPSVEDIVNGKISVSDIKDLAIEDLLNRESILPNSELLSKNIKDRKSVV